MYIKGVYGMKSVLRLEMEGACLRPLDI